MANDLQGSIGVSIKMVAGVPGTYDQAGFDTLDPTMTVFGFLETLPTYGGSATVETFDDMGTGVRRKSVSIFDYGDFSATVGNVREDAGQQLAKTGFDGTQARQRHSIIVTYPDGTRDAFTGLITSFTKTPGSAGPFIRGDIGIAIDAEVLELPSL